MSTKIGVIADTHGLLRPEVIDVLRGNDFIIHAGDIGGQAVLDALNTLAPTHAIRGNTDRGPWAQALPYKDVLEIEGRLFYIIHSMEALDLDPAAAEFAAVIFGHTHRPDRYEKDGVLYFNPGSAGPLRYRLSATVGRIAIAGAGLESEIITIIP